MLHFEIFVWPNSQIKSYCVLNKKWKQFESVIMMKMERSGWIPEIFRMQNLQVLVMNWIGGGRK